jgi:hypothetical protein
MMAGETHTAEVQLCPVVKNCGEKDLSPNLGSATGSNDFDLSVGQATLGFCGQGGSGQRGQSPNSRASLQAAGQEKRFALGVGTGIGRDDPPDAHPYLEFESPCGPA